MERIDTIQGAVLPRDSAVALGFFDGVHKGHRAVLEQTRQEGLLRAAFSFSTRGPLPPRKGKARIYTDGQRARLLGACGMQAVLLPPFGEFASMGDAAFVDLLCGPLRARVVCCGEDYRFAKGGTAGAERLRELCAARGARVIVVPPVDEGGERVSSTRIRTLLETGDIRQVNALLGRRYFIESMVQPGQQLGRVLGFPTTNQHFAPDQVLPRYGVYAALAEVQGKTYAAVTSIGVKPTVGAHFQPKAETYIMGFSGDLYGREITVELEAFIRPETRFGDLEALKKQIARDCSDALLLTRDSLEAMRVHGADI